MCDFKMLDNVVIYATKLSEAVELGGAYYGDRASSFDVYGHVSCYSGR